MKDTYNGFIFNHCFIGFDKTILPTKRKNDFTLSSYPYIRPLKQSQKEGEEKYSASERFFLLVSTVIIHYIIFNLGETISWRTTNIATDKMRCNIFHTFHKYTSNQPFKNDFAQSFSLAFIIRKNALILYSFSEEKEVQNGLFYHFIYKTLVVNWSNMLHREVT